MTEHVFNATDATLTWSGAGWQATSLPQVGNFRKTSEFNDSVSIVLPTGTTAVAAHGTTNFGHMNYSATLDGQPQGTWNASTFWLVPEPILFLSSGLEASSQHTLVLSNAYKDQVFSLTSVTAYVLSENRYERSFRCWRPWSHLSSGRLHRPRRPPPHHNPHYSLSQTRTTHPKSWDPSLPSWEL